MKKLLLAFFALPLVTNAQLAQWDCTGQASPETLDASLYDANLVQTHKTLTRGTGAAASNASNSFRTVGFQNDGIAVTNTDYFEHTFEAETGYTLSFSSIEATVNGTNSFVTNNNNGGVLMNYGYSVNGSPYVLLTAQLKTNVGASAVTFDASGITALQNIPAGQVVKFRFYASGQSTTGGWGYATTGAIFNGTLTAAAGCNIATADLTALTCNNNTTTADPADDYISFSLNPTGSQLGATYTVSVSSGTITPTTGTYGAATSFQLQDGSAGAGNVTVTITDADESGCTLDVAITDPGSCSSAVPVITATPATLTGFNHQVGTPSASQPFTVSGIALSDDITVTAPTGFEVSLDNTTFTASVTLTPVSGTVAATTVHARGNAAIYGPFSGNIIASSTGADNDTVAVSGFADDYVYYTIDQINGTDANGAADSLNVLVTITGVLHCMDFRAGSGYNMAIIDGSGEGMYIFATNDVSGYTTPMAGDSIEVKGIIDQFNGLLQVRAHAITLLESGVATNAPIVVTALNESTENQYVTLENVTLVTPIATFPTTNTNLDVTDGTTTFQIRILTSTNLGGTPAPQGPFNVTGIGSQFDSSSPYTSGYQLLPCGTDAIEIVCAGANLPNLAVTTAGMTATATATGMTYQWINCADNSPVSGATNRTYTVTTAGSYAVIIDNGTCADTSACVALAGVSVESLELGQSIVAYPNPVNELLTINNYSNMDVTYTITDINGKVISETAVISSVATVNTLSWNKGVYFVTFNGANNATHTLKVIK